MHDDRRQRVLLGTLGVFLGLVAVVLFLRGGSAENDETAPAPARAAAAPGTVPGAVPPAGDDGVARAGTEGGTRPRPQIAPGGLARAAAEDYRHRARYPRASRPLLSVEEDPIARERDVHPVKARGPRGEEPTLSVYPALVGFEAPEPALVYAVLAVGDRRVAADDIRATVVSDQLQRIGEIVYRDDGTNGDAEADDRIYTATFVPGAESEGRLSTSYMVRVLAVTTGREERIAVTSFLYSFPNARLTGVWRDAVIDGSLQVQAEVLVASAGRFHLEASLYDAAGARPLAWSQTATELPEGVSWMTLPYYGLILRESGVDGPYVLRHVALSTVSDMPNAKNRLVENAHRTAAYRATGFTDKPFDDASMLDAAARVEHDTAALGGVEAGG